ncbi:MULTISPECIES: sensor histidine kinase [unclassified Sphingomonas]|uniref:sensor histidine kinase n=1 Tax=unclassified Sphingomonas TaxID=196159 RepID=UPI0006F3F30C|nr:MULTISPECIES: sensor histidine kinase KdpD [unclassified Sphingomonas]KQX20881.1 histidine kinase [Sphingomonas sp. Root1294]KQY68727.1 histidine kinase [Sphingomonas sp. Root50]KRB88133.1 histidine kinase [Sphingomonas sp. Root720]
MNERRTDGDRPAPEAFLRQAAQEGRGRLKLFLGAAPGVGKTYEMLTDGMQRKRAGVDVVVGVVETHGRIETEALTRGHEIVPRVGVDYQGRTLAEMDIDGILSRHPELVLVDELAHSNAPGSRHPKRYQDVEELLAAGIDVYSTINVQHIESLNDVVASFTKVRVRETVPDRVLETAEIEVVDIPPDELIERLKDGKVYIPDEASRALNHFFSKSNLSALRELALRRAAQAVDAQMLDYVRAHALAGSFAAGERVIVALSERSDAPGLVRAAKRLADALRAPWTALHVETPRTSGLSADDRQRLDQSMALAAQLGAATATIPARNVVEGLCAYAAEARATQIVVGKSSRSWWFEFRHGSVVDQLVRNLKDVAVHVLPADGTRATAAGSRSAGPGRHGKPSDYLYSTLMVAGVTGGALALGTVLDIANIALLYLLPVMMAASLYGLRAGLFASLASSLAYNFFFLPPTGTFTVNNPENVVTIVVLLSVALVTSQFAARMRAQADLATSSARLNAALAGFSRQLTTIASDEELMQAICAELARLFDARACVLTPSDDGPQLRAAWPPEDKLEHMERAAAQWAIDKSTPTGRGSDTLTGSDWLFYPMRTARGVLGVVGLARDDGGDPVPSDKIALLLSLTDQAALVLERMQLADEMRDVARLKERDRLRAALLSSVSHDLRTPLTAILAAVSEMRLGSSPELLDTVEAEAQRLNRFVANLLDMARVEAGVMRLHVEPTDLTDAIASAVHDTRAALVGHEIKLGVSPGLPLVRVDAQLFHHVLINLLDNAGRYADPGTPIRIDAERTPGELVLSILDEGPGLPPGREEEVFQTFARFEGSDRSKGGTGLGLAIVKGFADAMGLVAMAANRTGEPRGARFSIHFPERVLVRDFDQEKAL